ncbi:MAG: ABC transporter permease [Acidobacteriota bacterium]|nr:ABC transporter permease [Acidobacteriota bacterium]
MNTPSTAVRVRPFYWSAQRELWENRSLFIAPAAVAGIILFGLLISTITLPHRMPAILALSAAQQRAKIAEPYNMVAGLLLLTAFVVGMFYCGDALQSERRDRSILFWKSLPVSDLITVLAKAAIPLVALPVIIYPIIVAVQVLMAIVSSMVLSTNGLSSAPIWAQFGYGSSWIALLYGLTVVALWHAPIYAWLLLVSAWARRTAILWAVLLPGAICIVEKGAFNSTRFARFLGYRLIGWFQEAFVVRPDPLASLNPLKFITTPGLWIGLVFAALCLAGAVRLRRYRGPI